MTEARDDNPALTTGPSGLSPAVVGAAYPEPLDAIVLAGTHQNPRRLISGQNKAFLEIAGRPLVRHVVDALAQARQVGEIFVVGPSEQVTIALRGVERVHCVPQEGMMLSNSWAAIRAAEARRAGMGEATVFTRPLLIISSDLPLISAAAVDDFVTRCAAKDAGREPGNALLVGVADDAGLRPYYGEPGRPGIQRPVVHLDCGGLRLANIYVARPRHLAHQEFLQTSFSYRKAKNWRNVLKLVGSLFRQHGGWAAAWMTLRLQAASMLSRGQGRLYQKICRGNTLGRVEQSVSTVLGGPVRVVVTPYGGLSLDVDDAEDYRVLSGRYREWMAVMEAVRPNGDGAS